MSLHTGSLAPVVFDGFTLRLVDLSPYPFSARPIAPAEYRATLRLTRCAQPRHTRRAAP